VEKSKSVSQYFKNLKSRRKAENDVHDGERRVGPLRRKRSALAYKCNQKLCRKLKSQIYP